MLIKGVKKMNDFTSLDKWFFEKHEIVEKLMADRNSTKAGFNGWMEKLILKSIEESGCNFKTYKNPGKYYLDLIIFKDNWKRKTESKENYPPVSLDVWAWDFDCLSNMSYRPSGGVFYPSVKGRLHRDKVKEFMKNNFSKKKVFDLEGGYYYHLDFPPINEFAKFDKNKNALTKRISDAIKELLEVSDKLDKFIIDNKFNKTVV